MGGVVNTLARAGTAFMTGGFSELARKKPFQPGGDDGGNVLKAAVGPYATAAMVATESGKDSITPKIPDPPAALEPVKESTPAVQQAVSEASQRRSRARGYRSTILNQMMPKNMRETFGG